MSVKILDCTLRDGGYITDWNFGRDCINNILSDLTDAGIDFIECGYLNNREYQEGSAIFNNAEQIRDFLPEDRKNSHYLAMVDVTQFTADDLTAYTGNSIDGIRVVFYKHQVEEALAFCKQVKKRGYLLFVQPMVTIDYTIQEYASLAERINELDPYSVAIVDSFGYMNKEDFRKYFMVLDSILNPSVYIGFHSHNNMQLAFITAQDIFEYKTSRMCIIDSSLYGMGRGAGNLNTELIANYYNCAWEGNYDSVSILTCIDRYIMPIRKYKEWGYSPYLLLTGMYHCHPNFACYLLETHDISVHDFEKYLKMIPEEMRTKCRKPYVEELYQAFLRQGSKVAV